MSWEGYQQNICVNGHSYNCEADDDEPPCCICQAPCAWWNVVDTTNGSYNLDDEGNETNERIDGYVELEALTPAEMCICAGCGNNHIKTHATFRIPESVGYKFNHEYRTNNLRRL